MKLKNLLLLLISISQSFVLKILFQCSCIVLYCKIPTPLAAREKGTTFQLRNNCQHRGPLPNALITSFMGERGNRCVLWPLWDQHFIALAWWTHWAMVDWELGQTYVLYCWTNGKSQLQCNPSLQGRFTQSQPSSQWFEWSKNCVGLWLVVWVRYLWHSSVFFGNQDPPVLLANLFNCYCWFCLPYSGLLQLVY